MPENPTPDPVEPPDDFPMTLTEWTKLHRLLSIGRAQLSVSGDRIPALDLMGDPVVLRFSPAVKAQRYRSGVDKRQAGTITHACLSRDGLRIVFAGEGVQGALVRIADIASVEQVL